MTQEYHSIQAEAKVNKVAKLVKRTPEEILQALDEACSWAQVSRGRSLEYKCLFREFAIEGKRSREHIFAHNELMNIIEIYELWRHRVDDFPGLEHKIREVFTKGPVLPEDENPSTSSNRPRNDSFTILLAGKLIDAGVSVKSVDGIRFKTTTDEGGMVSGAQGASDIVVECGGAHLAVECKRPLSTQATGRRIKKASEQLNIHSTPGIIAIDCSVAIRPEETILETSSEEEAIEFLIQRLLKEIKPFVDKELTAATCGAILYVRVPVHTVVGVSSILGPNGHPVTTYQQNTASTLVFLENASSPHMSAFRLLHEGLVPAPK